MAEVLLWVAIAVAALVAVVALAAQVERRGWTDEEYEARRQGGTALGNAVLATQALFEPGAQHVLEQRNDDSADHEESGGPPDPRRRQR